MNEFGIVSKYFSPLTKNFAGALNLSDDACIFSPDEGYELVITKDVMASDVHFFENDSAFDIAWKLLSVNVSDLAAMGAKPAIYMLGLTLPKGTDEAWLGRFCDGLQKAIEFYGGALAGGDTTSHEGKLILSLTAIGQVKKGSALKRSGATIGDDIYVSGTIGDALLGLLMLKGQMPKEENIISRYHRPTAKIELGQQLAGIATSCIDVSDGLISDMGHICECSNIGAKINIADIPLSEPAQEIVKKYPDVIKDMITGGDDYELLFTASVAMADKIKLLPVTKIGRVIEGRAVIVVDKDNKEIKLDKKGYVHF